MNRKLQSLVVLALVSYSMLNNNLFAQQDPYTTHYMFNRTLYNPAAVGANNLYCATILSHFQYLGYEDRTPEFYPENPTAPTGPKGNAKKNVGPKTQAFTFSAPITQYGGLGIGLMTDKLGYESSTHIKIAAAGRYPMLSGATISVGLEANILQKSLNGDELIPLANFDPSIPTSKVSDMHPIFSTGAYYNDPMANNVSFRDLWAGVSVLGINKPVFEFSAPGGANQFSFVRPTTHTYMMGGITLLNFMDNPDLELLPSMMLKYNRGIVQADLTALVKYQKRLWGGIAYRTTADAFSVLLGYSGFQGRLTGLRIGYSYDLTLTKILSVSSGSHELQLNYCFVIVPVVKEKVNIVTPPFMHRKSNY